MEITISESVIAANVAGTVINAALTEQVQNVTLSYFGLQGAPSQGGTADYATTAGTSTYSLTSGTAVWSDATDQVEQYVKAGTTIAKGQAVYVTGATGTNVIIGLAQANAEPTSSKTLGLALQDLANNAFGYVVTEGLVEGINTSGANAGDPVWLSPTTPGGLVFGTSSIPSAPNHMVYIGVVVRVNQNNGAIFVKVQNGFELQELHNVAISSVANNDLLKYDSATSLWKNVQTIAASQVAGTAITTTSGTALAAQTAGTATFATTSGSATNAGTSVYATNAGTSVYASTSGTSLYANTSGTASFATNAGTSVYSTNAGTSVYATNAGTSVYATNAGTSVFATNAGTSVFATNAGTSVYATNAGTSVYANTSGTASFASAIGTGVVGIAQTVAPVSNVSAGVGAVYFCDNPASATANFNIVNKVATWVIDHQIGRYPLTIQIVSQTGSPIAITGYGYTAGKVLPNAVSITRSSGSSTATVSSTAHGLSVGDSFSVTGTGASGVAGTWTVASVAGDGNSFTYVSGATTAASVSSGLQVYGKLGRYATVQFGTPAASYSANQFRAVLIG